MHPDSGSGIRTSRNRSCRAQAVRNRLQTTTVRWGSVLIALIGMTIGCHNKPVQVEIDESALCECGSELFWMSPVSIVPVCNDGGDNHILLSFCGELATALLDHRVPDVTIKDVCQCPCPAKPPVPTLSLEPDLPPVSGVVMYVAVPDFRPYRPMRMAVDVRVVQAADEREVARIVDVFEGLQETPLRESPREFRLFRDRDREARADEEAYTAFFSNSPRQFITGCAHRVVDRLRYCGPVGLPAELPVFPESEPPLTLEPAVVPDDGPVLPEP